MCARQIIAIASALLQRCFLRRAGARKCKMLKIKHFP